ncbi:MAG TPA: aldehyde dehydrogenase family protein, partial [Candidatus Elarobacter sp.]
MTIFADGRFAEASSGETLPVVDPATGRPTGPISAGDATDVDVAVRSAVAASEGAWGRLPAADRGRLLRRMSDAIAEHAERLARVECADTGKPISQARADIAAAVRYFEFYAGGADKLHGETIPYLPGYAVQVLRVPAGVSGHIIPWNYPAQMFARSLAPSLAVGNATVIKPSEDASQSVIELAKLAAEVGFPAGAINVVTGLGETAGAALAAHPGVDVIDFIGSPEVGTLVQTAAAQHHARCILELGGKSAQVVFADADLDAAVPAIVKAIVQNAGQTCSAGSRVLIEASAFEGVGARVAEAFAHLRVGLPADDPDVGPLINRSQFARVSGFVERARRDNVRLLGAGTLPGDLPADGFYV